MQALTLPALYTVLDKLDVLDLATLCACFCQDHGIMLRALHGSWGQIFQKAELPHAYQFALICCTTAPDHRDNWFFEACKQGHFALAKTIYIRFDYHEKRRYQKSIEKTFRHVCQNGHLAIAQWMQKTWSLDAKVMQSHNCYALRWACCNGHVGVAQWVWDPASYASVQKSAFAAACSSGNLDLVQWPWASCASVQKSAFAAACSSGNLELVQWLWENMSSEAQNVWYSYRNMYDNDKPQRERTAHEMDRLDYDKPYAPLWLACRNGHLPIVKWLASIVDLSSHAKLEIWKQLFVRACSRGHVHVAQWLLAERMQPVSKASESKVMRKAQVKAGKNRHYATLNWLYSVSTRVHYTV